MNPEIKQFDIVLARIEFANCNDLRPCLVLYPPKAGVIEVAPISSQPALFDEFTDFWIEEWNPDFPATGLTRRSFVVANKTYFVDIADIRKRIGRMEINLTREFKDWYGL